MVNVARAAINMTPTTPGAWRHRLVIVLLVGSACVVFGRAFYLQVLDDGFLSHQGDIRFVRTITLPGFRGAITARNGAPLALSAPVESIWGIPKDILAAPRYLPALAELLNESEPELRKYLQARKGRSFVFLQREMAPDAAHRVLALKAPGVYSQRDYRRYYPAGAVAAQVVGFTNIDGKGQAGIERVDNKLLDGVEGHRGVVRDGSGRVVQDTGLYQAAQPGKDVALTLDLRLQYVAFRNLQAAVEAHHAKSGSMIIADPRTGAILALVNVPSFNPNDTAQRVSAGTRDRAVSNSFEPGSSIKPFLVAQALASGKFDSGSRIPTDGGEYRVGPMVIHDDDDFGVVDLQQLLQKSSNVAAAKIGLALGPEAIWQGYRAFGLGQRTGIGLPDEAVPTLRPWQTWRDVATATASYGYGIAFSLVQMVQAYCAIANDGLMPRVHIVADRNNVPPRRVMSPHIARRVRHMLETVVSPDGTAPKAAVPGYRVAGKTGTSRMTVNGSYARGKYHAIFAGMLPADRPQLVAMVIINAPAGYNYFGGSVAAPVFSSVMSAAARMMQIAPDATTPHLLPLRQAAKGAG
ncbi:MAG: penicillin-binding protein 2 [Sinobacteraceae bacterium]|nr:penicillin-binding protein 2 [Nevskiaceae bacterium]